MINIPYNVPLMAQIAPSQNIPVQTSQNNFQAFQQPQTVTQQMQTQPSTNPQDTYKQPFYQLHQADVFFANHQYIPNALPPRNPYPVFQSSNVPPPLQTQPNCGSLSPNILEQIRGCVSNPAPIFILPGSCHQSTNHHQQPPPMCPPSQGGVAHPTGQSTSFNCPPSICCPPSFYPFPIPLPIYEPFPGQTRGKDRHQTCGCCHRYQGYTVPRNYPLSCCCNLNEPEEHCCGPTNDDTICSKRNCPASISLQALASQFLALPGIISCAATRLILRKVPGSNITTTMEDTMEKAQRSISVLTKEQLLAESRIAQQVNALINLHMTTTLPANIIPLLTLLQLKVNVLKAQVEALINKKVMECQGYGFEVETSGPIDPAVLALKTNAELRQLLSALRQKECDERLNANFSPYHSQRVIAEARLNAVQAKIRQVEAEFENRRCPPLTAPTITSRIIQQFAESRCTFGFAHTNLFEPYVPENIPESPDPFGPSPRNPRRLYIQPYVPEPPAPQKNEQNRGTSTSKDAPSTSQDKGTGEGSVDDTKDRSPGRRCSADSCICDSSSEESLEEGKKKLRLRIDRAGHVRISSVARLRNVPLMKLAANVVAVIDVEEVAEVGQLAIPDCDSPWSQNAGSLKSEKTSLEDLKDEETYSKGIVEDGTKDAKRETEEESSLKDDAAELRFEFEEVNAESENNEDVKASDYEGVSIKKGESEENGGNETSKELREGIENPRTLETDESGKDTVTNGSSRINPKDDESRRENGAERNVRIVAMVTNIKYDRRFGDFERWMVINECSDERTKDRCGRNAANESLGDTKEENETDGNYTCLLSEKIDPLPRSVDRGCEPRAWMTAKDEEMHREVKTNAYSKNTYEGESNFEINRVDGEYTMSFSV
ncbi:uncharacterized protein LOC128885572 [Hylaeus anthracinus]|uniref:uncharacterized protein LOC128885572 n=1 Tax=Hylaeus anthracinus TaxID=313031 RepID=UPI0023B9EDC9|nr:uncharacterized protein LOC128885572 [Hylaeus anthracinus]